MTSPSARSREGRAGCPRGRAGSRARWKGIVWAMSLNATGPLERVGSCSRTGVFNLSLQGTRSSCCLMEHTGSGALRHISCHSQQASPLSRPQRNVAPPGHYSSAVTFSLLLVGGQRISTDHASCSALTGLTCARHVGVCWFPSLCWCHSCCSAACACTHLSSCKQTVQLFLFGSAVRLLHGGRCKTAALTALLL